MKKDTMVLKDGNCIDLEECSSLASIKVIREPLIYDRSLGKDE